MSRPDDELYFGILYFFAFALVFNTLMFLRMCCIQLKNERSKERRKIKYYTSENAIKW
jgi:hypothetical protein